MTKPSSIAVAIEKERKRQGRSIVSIARATGTDPSALSRFLRGKAGEVGVARCEQICHYLGIGFTTKEKE